MTVQTVNLMAIATSGNKVSVTSKNDCCFESFLETGSRDDVKPESTASASGTQMQSQVSDEPKKSTAAFENVKASESSDAAHEPAMTEDTAPVSQTGETAAVFCETEELPEDVLAKILSLLNGIVSILQDTLQFSEQPLLDAAKAIQFEVTDFFDADRMKELFLQVQGFETSDLLINEELYQTLEMMQSELADILNNSGFEQLLLEDGILPEQFEISMFKEQIVAYINDIPQPEVVSDVAEVVIEFDKEFIMDSEQLEKSLNQDSIIAAETVVGTSEDSEAGFAEDEPNSSASDKGFDQAMMFLQKLAASAGTGETESIQRLMDGFDLYDIARQIIEQVKIQIRPENTRMEIQLNPEHLGKVELEITSKNGELSARLNVQNDYVKEAIESQMQVLREALEVQGLKVENIEVTVAEFGFRFQDESAGAEQQQQRQRRNGRVAIDDADSEETGFSDVSEVMKEMNGNIVDYVA